MTVMNRRRSPALSMTLWVLLFGSLVGIAYCVIMLTGLKSCSLTRCRLVYYAVYFVVGAISVVAIFRWKRWGVYSLATATFSVAVIDYIEKAATLQDFIAIMVLIAGSAGLMQQAWSTME